MRKWILQWISLSLTAGLLFTGTVRSQSWFNANITGQTWQGNARAMALGYVGTAEAFGVMNLFTNPALLAEKPGLQLEATSNSSHRLESRAYPAIDQFGDVVTDNIYNITESWQTLYNAGGVWSSDHVALAVGTAPYWSPFFRYREDVRGNLSSSNYNRDPLVGSFQWDRSGVVQETAFGLGSSFKNLKTGVSIGLFTGRNLNVTKGTVVITPDAALDTDTTNVTAYDYELEDAAILYRIGLSYDVTPRFRIAWNYESGTEMTFSTANEMPYFPQAASTPGYLSSDTTLSYTQTRPGRMSLGVRMQPRNLLRTSAYFEVERQDWSQFKSTYPDSIAGEIEMASPFSETITFRGGVEHELFNGLPVRAGFVYAGSPLVKSLAQTWITMGSGYTHGNLVVDVAMAFGNVDYSYPDLFVSTAQTYHGEETVHETTTKFALSLAYVFNR